MTEHNMPNIYSSLNEQQFRLNKIVKLETISLVRLGKDN